MENVVRDFQKETSGKGVICTALQFHHVYQGFKIDLGFLPGRPGPIDYPHHWKEPVAKLRSELQHFYRNAMTLYRQHGHDPEVKVEFGLNKESTPPEWVSIAILTRGSG